ncbi:MAG: hypothetical protein WBG90_00330 [Saonia sp.]
MLRIDWKHSTAYFFLFAFLLMRVVNLHTVSHVLTGEEYEHCELCDLITTTDQGTPLQISTPQVEMSFASFLDGYNSKSLGFYSTPYQKTILSDYFHNKPPPVLSMG